MEKSIITVNNKTSKQDLLLFLVSFTKKTNPKVFIDVEDLPSFINSEVSFLVFVKSLRNYPKEIYWTSKKNELFTFLKKIEGVLTIRYVDFLDLSTEKKQKQIGSLTYSQRQHLETKNRPVQEFLLPHSSQTEDSSIGSDNIYINSQSEVSDYEQEVENFNIAKRDLEDEIINKKHDITYFQDNGIEETATIFSPSSKSFNEVERTEGNKLQNLDVLIEKLEKTKLDLTKKGKYPLKVSELISMKYKPTWVERIMPLSSVSSSIVFVLFLVVISLLILFIFFPLTY